MASSSAEFSDEKRQAASLLALSEVTEEEAFAPEACQSEHPTELVSAEASLAETTTPNEVSTVGDGPPIVAAELIFSEDYESSVASHHSQEISLQLSQCLVQAYLNQVNLKVTEAIDSLGRQQREWMERHGQRKEPLGSYHQLLAPLRQEVQQAGSNDPPERALMSRCRCTRTIVEQHSDEKKEDSIPGHKPDPPAGSVAESLQRIICKNPESSTNESVLRYKNKQEHEIWQATTYLKRQGTLRHSKSCPVPRVQQRDDVLSLMRKSTSCCGTDPPSLLDGRPIRKPDPPAVVFGQTILGFQKTSLFAQMCGWTALFQTKKVKASGIRKSLRCFSLSLQAKGKAVL